MKQHNFFMSWIFLNMRIQLTDRFTPTLDRLQKDATSVAQDAGDTTAGIELA